MNHVWNNITFDAQAKHIMLRRLTTLRAHVRTWARSDERWGVVLREGANAQVKSLLAEVKHEIRNEDITIWRKRLYKIGQDLNIVNDAQYVLFLTCRSLGWFDQPQPRGQQPHRPDPEEIWPHFFAVFRDFGTKEQRVKALVEHRLCRDQEVAQQVAQEFIHLNFQRAVVSRAYAILQAWCEFGRLGLLHLSSYPFYEELRLLKAQLEEIEAVNPVPPAVVTMLVADVIALGRGICSVDADLWHPNLLHESPVSPSRERYEKKLLAPVRAAVTTAIVQYRGCEVSEAGDLLVTFVRGGLTGLINRRQALTAQNTYQTVEWLRTKRALQKVCVGLDPEVRQEAEHLVQHMFDAAQEVQVPFSCIPLITDHPSSQRRINKGRRFTFGTPSVIRRKQRRRPKKARGRQLREPSPDTSQQRLLEKQFVAAFAQRVSLSEKEARNRLRNFITYGVYGLLPHTVRNAIIDQRLFSWLHLIKYGHAKGNIFWSDVYRRAAEYSALLGTSLPSSQILRSVFNSIPKPRHWHGGKGIVLMNVHKRLPDVATDLPRLNAAWFVLHIKLRVRLAEQHASSTSDTSHLLLVVDKETQLPVGGWLSDVEPVGREVGLALYQAIWHPGVLHWPIRGIPQVIHIPHVLMREGEHIERAASYLLTEIKEVDKISLAGKSRSLQMVKDIQQYLPDEIRRVAGIEQPTSSQALRMALEWIAERYFPHHREARAPLSNRRARLAMPGHDTPAAGWLLPVPGYVDTTQDGVLSDGHRYTSTTWNVQPNQQLPQRSFPYFYPNEEIFEGEAGIFVEVVNGQGACLHYLIV